MAATPETSEGFAQKLADSGLRNTPQREVVYGVLMKKQDHPTVDELYVRVKQEMPTISLATVYNCVEALVQCKLVRQVNFERGPTRYCPNLKPHAHFHDELTGATYDIALPETVLGQVNAILPPGYAAKSVEVIFRGSAQEPRPEPVEGRSSASSFGNEPVEGRAPVNSADQLPR